MSIGQQFVPAAVLGTIFACVTVGAPAAAQVTEEPTARRFSMADNVRHLYVPAEDPGAWPPGNWAPIVTEDLQEFLQSQEQHEASAPDAFLERMVYRAQFSGQSLQGGTFEGVARLRSGQPQFVNLGSPSLFLHHLRWSQSDVLWGSTPEGLNLLRVESDGQTLAGKWSLAGQRVFENVEFDVSIPPAVVSQLELEIPKTSHLVLEGGLLSGVLPSKRAGWAIWSIDLGHRTSCRITVVAGERKSAAPENPVQASQSVQYSLRVDRLHLQTEVTIEQAEPSAKFLEFVVPEQMQLLPVTLGSDHVLPVKPRQEGDTHLLRVDVRGLTLAPGMTIRMRGKLPFPLGRTRALPKLELRSGRWLRTRRSVTVVRPLELDDIRTEGCQLLRSSMDSEGDDVLEYEDYSPQSRIRVRVDRPQPNFSATVVSHVQWRDDDPLMRSTLLLKALSGSTFSVECRVPANWEVTKLESNAATPVAQWRYIPKTTGDEGQDAKLFIEFRKPLSSQLLAEVVIWCRQLGPLSEAPGGEHLDVPAVVPNVSGDREVWVVVEPLDGIDFDIEADSAFERVRLNALMDEWGGLLPEELSRFDDDQLLVLRADDAPTAQPATMISRKDASAKQPLRSPPSLKEHEHPASTSSVSAALTLETTIATDHGQLCRNRAVFELPGVSVAQQLNFELPSSSRLISAKVVDSPPDQHIASLHKDGQNVLMTLSPSQDPCRLEILYDSPLRQSLISGTAQIPVPEWNGRTSTIAWEVLLPDECRLGTPTDGTSAQPPVGVSWSQRVFGPLGRFSSDRLAPLFSAESWESLLNSQSDENRFDPWPAGQVPQNRIRRSLPGGVKSLSLTFWSASQARRAGWVTLALGLFLTTWPHRKQRLLSTPWLPGIILGGLLVALLAPDSLAIPCGGFVMGTILGLLIPDDWRIRSSGQIRSPHHRIPEKTRITARLQASGVCLLVGLVVCLRVSSAWQTVPTSETSGAAASASEGPFNQRLDMLVPLDADADPESKLPETVYLQREQLEAWSRRRRTVDPDVLIQSAKYEVTGFDSSEVHVVAQFDVVLLHPEKNRRVFIPVTGALFPHSDACRVDGVTATLLPHQTGDGVVVEVPPAVEKPSPQSSEADPSTDSEAPAYSPSEPKIVRVTLEFRPRPSELQGRPRLRLGIPSVLDSEAVFRIGDPESPQIDVAHRGAVQSPGADGLWHVALGGISQLIADPSSKRAGRNWVEPKSVVSLIETHQLQHHVLSRLVFERHREADALSSRTLELVLPPEALVHDVRSVALSRMRTETDDEDQVRLHLTFHDVPTEKLVVELDFDLPISPNQHDAGVTLPALPLLSERSMRFPVYHVGISAAPGFEINGADSPDRDVEAREAISELLTDWLGARQVRRPDIAQIQDVPRAITIPLSLIVPDIDVSASQTVTVLPSRIDWTARLDVTVRDAAVPGHRIAIDPRLRIQQVSVRQEEVDRLAKWSQPAPGELRLFLSEEFTGSQTVQLQGTLAIPDRHEFPVPWLELEAANPADPSSILIRHADELSVDVLRGTEVLLKRSSPSTVETSGVLREQGPFRLNETHEPLVVRIDPSEGAWDLEQVTLLRSRENGSIEQISSVHARKNDLPTKLIDVLVTSVPEEFAVESSLAASQQMRDPNGNLVLQLTLPDPPPETWTLDVINQLEVSPASSWTLPSFSVSEARDSRQFVVITSDMVIDLSDVTTRPLAPDDLPSWYSEQSSTGTEDWSAWKIDTPEEPVEATYNGDAGASVRMLDSAIWQQAGGKWRGVTVVEVVAHRDVSVPFAIPDGLSVDTVMLNGAEQSKQTGQEIAFELTKQTTPHRCLLWWTLTGRLSSDSEIPLPHPVEVQYSHTDVVVLGQSEQYYFWRPQIVQEENVELLRELTAADDQAGGRLSPITRALQGAGVSMLFDSPVMRGTNQPGVMSVRLPASTTTLRIHSWNRQFVHMSIALGTLFLVVMAWLFLGQWLDINRLSQGSLSGSSLGMLSLGLIIWYWGAGVAGLLLILAGGWRCYHDVRRSQSKAAADPPSSPTLAAG